MDNLECPICLDLARDAVECTQCASILCEVCAKELKKCPICRAEKSFKDSAFARKIINNLPQKCQYCDFKAPLVELKYHLPKCENRKYECNVCVFSGSKEDFLKHLVYTHNEILYDYFTSNPNQGLSSKFNVLWENKTKFLKHQCEIVTTQTALQPSLSFNVKIRIKKTKNSAFIVLGFSNKPLHVAKGYLGGDFGLGNWGLAGNGALGEEGKWKKGETFKENDVITLNYDSGKITYRINNIENKYSYIFNGAPQLYLASSMYYIGDELEIIN